jgi:glycine dehydrogenase
LLLDHHQFRNRHIGPNKDQQQQMLDYLGIKDLSELMEKALPEAIHYRGGSQLPDVDI